MSLSKPLRVLSLFDGMSCGRVALERAGIPVEKYYASEIDQNAITVSRKNYPDIIQLGDVTKINFYDLGEIDLLIGGSPCQGFSFSGLQLNFEDPRSKLFFDFVRALTDLNPKYFLLENVIMKKEFQDVITEYLGVEPIEINSSLVSGQSRNRLYWTNLPNVVAPKDKGILLADIIEENSLVDRDKRYCLDASYFKGSSLAIYFERYRRQIVFNYSSSGRGEGRVEGRFTEAKKALCLTASGYSNRAITCVTVDADKLTWRKLTVKECERLQTLDDNYTEANGVSKNSRYKMLGNGWTVDAVSHILKCGYGIELEEAWNYL